MLEGVTRADLFPTMIYSAEIHGAQDLNATLINSVLAEHRADPKGMHASNQPALGGWHSRTDLHRQSEFTRIAMAVRDLAHIIAEALGYDPSWRLDIDQMWAIANAPGSSNSSHVHPGALWSGVYYIQAADGAGDIEFTDPRAANVMQQARHTEKPELCRTAIRYTPRAGLMLMFPSWLYHSVHPNLSQQERVILSFNLSQS